MTTGWVIEERRIEVGGHRLAVKSVRPGARPGTRRPVMVFLHQGLGAIDLWRDFPNELAAATGCAALIYDRLGHGRSDPLDCPRAVGFMHFEALKVLPGVLDIFRVPRAILIGQSDGGSIALIFASLAATFRTFSWISLFIYYSPEIWRFYNLYYI